MDIGEAIKKIDQLVIDHGQPEHRTAWQRTKEEINRLRSDKNRLSLALRQQTAKKG